MKHLKIIGLAVVAAAALMAFAGSASAATLTSPSGTAYSGTLTATASESLLLKAGFTNITCTESTVSGKVETNNEEHAAGKITTLTYGTNNTCAGSTYTVDVLSLGTLTVQKGTGTVTATGVEVTVADPSAFPGVTCVYGAGAGTVIGTLKGGTPATLQISASLTRISGGFTCANPATWSGKYTVTTPSTLLVD